MEAIRIIKDEHRALAAVLHEMLYLTETVVASSRYRVSDRPAAANSADRANG